jgi:hypothetical protein
MPGKLLAQRDILDPTGKTGVMVIDLFIQLPAGDLDALRVHHNHNIANRDPGGKHRLVLAKQ